MPSEMVELMVGSSTTSRVATMDIRTPKRSNQRPNPALDESKEYTMRCGFKMPLIDNGNCSSPGGQEGAWDDGPESENAEPNTVAGSGKPKAILRQMSLPYM